MSAGYLALLKPRHVAIAAGFALSFSLFSSPTGLQQTRVTAAATTRPPHLQQGDAGDSGKARDDGASAGLDRMSTGSVPIGVFGSVAFPFKPDALAQWQHMRQALDRLAPEDCAGSTACRTRMELLQETVSAITNAPVAKKVDAVNLAVNRLVRYDTDADIYGTLDHWATPVETLSAGRGDCEDYALLKLAALRSAGLPAESLALVVVRDAKRNFFHAVLAVSTTSQTYILDNLRDAVLPDSALPQYQALFSLGAQRAWVHGYRRDSEFAMQKRPASLEAVLPGEGVANPS
jgi:predicted transglutaminase-like cysteine proteinase